MENKGNSLNFLKNTLIFFIGSVLSKVVTFLLLPVYTTIIPSVQMGQFDVSVTLITMVLSICYFEIWSGVLRYLYMGEKDDEKGVVIKSGTTIFLISSIFFIILSSIICGFLKYKYVLLIILYGLSYGLSTFMTFVARGLGKNIEFSVSGVLNTLIQLSLNILLLLVFKFDYSALYISYIIGCICQSIYLIRKTNIIKHIKTQSNYSALKNLLYYSLPLCMNTVAYWALSSGNRLIYNWVYGDSASGVYSIGNRFGSMIVLATTCFTYAWQDLAFTSIEKKSENVVNLYNKACDKYLCFLVFATTLILPFIYFTFPYLIKGDYGDSFRIIPSFIFVAVISGYSAFVGNIFYAIKETKIISISTIISAGVNLIISYPIIKSFGALGANYSILVSFIINIWIRVALLKKIMNFTIFPKKILLYCLWIAIVYFFYLLTSCVLNIVGLIFSIFIGILMFRNDIVSFVKK